MRPVTIKTASYLAMALSLGCLAALWLNEHLAIEFRAKTLPTFHHTQMGKQNNPSTPLAGIAAISISKEFLRDDLYQYAVAELMKAIELKTGSKPELIHPTQALPPGLVISVDPGETSLSKGQNNSHSDSTEFFTVKSYSRRANRILTITSGGRMGGAYGIYWLADQIRTSCSGKNIFDLDLTISPALPYRFVDSGGVGIAADSQAWGDDYLHHTRAFQHMMMDNEPYVNESTFQQIFDQFKQYVHRIISYGYNGIIVDGYLEFINFDSVGKGNEIYGLNSRYRKRQIVLRKKFRQLLEYGHRMGLRVVLATDMLPLTAPLKRYFDNNFGGINLSDKRLWAVYRSGLEELFEIFPFLDGQMIRIGEAGAIYNLDGWPYYSALLVKNDESVRTMLRELLAVAQKKGKKIYFRNWSVGVGQVGDMHTNPQTYTRVLEEIDSPSITVSTKYCKGDFYSYLPYNPTLMIGNQKRLIEFQARREFEGFNSVPNYLGTLYQSALLELLKHNKNIEGIWLWTQRGGPLRAGPLSLYPFHGFWLLIDANVYATARLAWDPLADLDSLTAAWVCRNFGDNAQTVNSLTALLYLSREAVLKGFYLPQFAQTQVQACSIETPTTPFIWDIVGGSNSVLSAVYFACKKNLGETVATGFEAVETVKRLKKLAHKLDLPDSQQRLLHNKLIESLDYEENLLETLAWYRKTFLSYYHWLDTGDSGSYQQWEQSFQIFEDKKKKHMAIYEDNLDFPAVDFFAVDAGMAHAQRSMVMFWLARVLLISTLAVLCWGNEMAPHPRSHFPHNLFLPSPWLAIFSPWRLENRPLANYFFLGLCFCLIIGCVLTFSSFLSLGFAFWTLLFPFLFFLFMVLLFQRISDSYFFPLAAVAGPLLCGVLLITSVLSVRGPLLFWYLFWISPTFRFFFISLISASLVWTLITVFETSRQVFKIGSIPALGNILVAIGSPCIICGLLIGFLGLEDILTTLNNEMAILPLSLSKVLGITTHLNIDPKTPFHLAALGCFMGTCGWMMRKH
jgi:hypothetical protein